MVGHCLLTCKACEKVTHGFTVHTDTLVFPIYINFWYSKIVGLFSDLDPSPHEPTLNVIELNYFT